MTRHDSFGIGIEDHNFQPRCSSTATVVAIHGSLAARDGIESIKGSVTKTSVVHFETQHLLVMLGLAFKPLKMAYEPSILGLRVKAPRDF